MFYQLSEHLREKTDSLNFKTISLPILYVNHSQIMKLIGLLENLLT